MLRDFEYESCNIGYDYQYPKEKGGGIKCINQIICDNILPKWWFECKGSYLCSICDMMFGKILEVKDNIECIICLEIKKCIKQPMCDHSVCINCFKKCYYGDETNVGEPIFPYPDIEDEYYEDQENQKWDINYPLIKMYNEEFNIWDNIKTKKYDNEEYLIKCPLCRK